MRIFPLTGVLSALATVLATAFAAPVAQAETFPARPIRIVVGFPTGGAPDTLARIVSEKISPSWG